MVTLKGLNYNVAQEQFTTIETAASATGTGLIVANTQGFSANDYIVINPYTETSEIRQIASVDSNTALTIDALDFGHATDVKIYRLPYDYMKFYSASTGTGSYSLITGTGTAMQYDSSYTNFPYPSGTSSLYYKRTFYNQTTLVESSIAEADYFQVTDDKYPTAELLRVFMQFDQNDYPTPEDMDQFMRLATIQISLDLNTGNEDARMLAILLKSREMVLRALANRAISKGYIQINAEGRNITKPHRELLEDAKQAKEDYLNFVTNNFRSETSSTQFFNDSSIIDSDTRMEILDRWTSVQNLMDFQNDYRFSYGFRQRRR